MLINLLFIFVRMELKVRKEIKIGILMVLTIAFFIWGYSFLKGKNLLTTANRYYVVYDKVEGLIESAHVIFSGYKVGYVDDISFVDDMQSLVVRISVDRRVSLPEGTVGKIFSSDIMGTKSLALIPGSSDKKHSAGDTLLAEIEPDLKEEINMQIMPLKLRAEDMMASMDSVLIIFQAILDRDFRESFASSIENISNTVSSLQRSVYAMDTLLTSEDSRFNRILDNLGSISENIAGSNDDISTILNNFAAISDSLSRSEMLSTINHLNDVLAETNQLMESVNKGEGSVGKLITDDELYDNLESATRNLDLLLQDLKERPGRYVNFSIFGKKDD